jgi:hypothetical protein
MAAAAAAALGYMAAAAALDTGFFHIFPIFWIIWKKSKLNSEKIWKIQKKIVK